MGWGPFSAEAVVLDSKLRQLHRLGKVSDAIGAIEDALLKAADAGPSCMTYEEFEIATLQAQSPETDGE
jgi:hypothetical protein